MNQLIQRINCCFWYLTTVIRNSKRNWLTQTSRHSAVVLKEKHKHSVSQSNIYVGYTWLWTDGDVRNSLVTTPVQQQAVTTITSWHVKHPNTTAITRMGILFSTGRARRWQRDESSCDKGVLFTPAGVDQLYHLSQDTASCCVRWWCCRSCPTLRSGTSRCYSALLPAGVWTVPDAGWPRCRNVLVHVGGFCWDTIGTVAETPWRPYSRNSRRSQRSFLRNRSHNAAWWAHPLGLLETLWSHCEDKFKRTMCQC